MVQKRTTYDPLATSPQPRWLKVQDMTRNEISSLWVEPLADLHQVINSEAARWAADGWTVESDGKWGSFFANRQGMRLHVFLAHAEHPEGMHMSPAVLRP